MENEIDLREIIRVLWRGRYIILGITVLSAILALVCSFLFTRPVYEATATIDPTPYREETGNNLLTKIPPNQVVLEAVQELSENPAELADSISLEPVGETGLLLVQAIHADPELCAD
ncbi:MAG: Wzz/FepE/Etk N-terminal domain-containing protein, partial [Dethiobacteria bacterium]